MKIYNVTYTLSVIGSVDIEASSYDEAYDKARDKIVEDAPPHDHLEVDYQPQKGKEVDE